MNLPRRISGHAYLYAIAVSLMIFSFSGAAFGDPLLHFIGSQKDVEFSPIDIAVSPDNKHAYVAHDNSVSVFSRNENTGEISFIEMHTDGVNGVDGLEGAGCVALTQSGGFVYIAGGDESAVAVFSRNDQTGELTYVEAVKNGINGVEGLWGGISIDVSPDNKNVYVAGFSDHAVVVFSRDVETGKLTFLEVQKDGLCCVDGLENVNSVTVSPDNNHVYVTSATENTVVVFARNHLTGALSFVERHWNDITAFGIGYASSVFVSPDNKNVYVAGWLDDAIAVFNRDPVTGKLTWVEMQQEGVDGTGGLKGVQSVCVSPDNKHLYAASWGIFVDSVAVFSRDTDTGLLTYIEHHDNGYGGIQEINDPHSIIVSLDGNNVYIAGNSVPIFQRNQSSGALTFAGNFQATGIGPDGLENLSSVAVSTDDNHVYATGYWENSVAAFSRNVNTGVLEFVEKETDQVNGVYGLFGAYSLSISPDDKHIYVVSPDNSAVAVFSRNSATGELTFVEAHSGLPGLANAISVAVGPDNDHVYVAGRGDDSIVIFSRNDQTGALTYVDKITDGVDGVDGLDGAYSVAVSPDNAHVYAAGALDNAVAVFGRDPGTGRLTFIEMLVDNVDSIDGLAYACCITISPDNNNVYVTGYDDNAIAVFLRNPTTGRLTFVEAHKNGVDGISGLTGANSVAVSPDNQLVYVTGYSDHSLVVFTRNTDTGALSFAELIKNDTSNVTGLRNPYFVSTSQNSRHVYVAGYADSSLLYFGVAQGYYYDVAIILKILAGLIPDINNINSINGTGKIGPEELLYSIQKKKAIR